MKIGFIGLGIMGRAMAANLARAGFELTVYNRTKSKSEEFTKEFNNAQAIDSPQAVAVQSDVVITIVSDTPDVREVILGENGVIQGAKPGLIVIDMSTISPQATKEIADELKNKEVNMIDAPVSGGDIGAIKGTLTIMAGGEKSAFDKVLPVFEAMGKTITYMGESSMGQATKLCNQIVGALNLLGACEALILAKKSGLDQKTMIKALSGGSAQSWMLENMGPKIVDRDFAPGFFVKLKQKDLRLVLDAAREQGLSLFGTSIVTQLFNSIEGEEGGGELGHISLIKALEKLAGEKD